MKTQAPLLLALLFSASAALAQVEKPVDSKITNVTVFLSKAQVTREIKTRVEAGKTTLVVTGLTAFMDTESIQAAGKGSFVILGIGHRQNFLDQLNVPKPLKVLKDSAVYYQKMVTLAQSQRDILNKEEQLLSANQRIGGNTQNISVAELKGMADFYRTRLTEIVNARMKEEEKITKFHERIAKINQQVNEQNELYSRNTGEILINVSAEAATTVDLAIDYIVQNAGWSPVYDLRAINTKSPVTIGYKANVYQSTGEEWKNVKLKLSTANPNQGGLKPELSAWYVNFREADYSVIRGLQGKVAGLNVEDKKSREFEADANALNEVVVVTAPAESIADYTSTIQTTLNTEFDISLPYTVTSASKPTVVDIRNYEMNSIYEYAVAPKLDNDAFLVARGLGWEEFNLLPGEANIFFEGTFVGKSFIDPNNIRDTLSVSLGRDKRIVVKREKVKDLTTRKVIGGNQRENYAWEISLRNTKTEAVKIVVEDQIPVSQNSQIEVTPGDMSGAKFDAITGKLTWTITLQPNETKKLNYKFEVKYPKDKKLKGL